MEKTSMLFGASIAKDWASVAIIAVLAIMVGLVFDLIHNYRKKRATTNERVSAINQTPWCYHELCVAIAKNLGKVEVIPGRRYRRRTDEPDLYVYEDSMVKVSFKVREDRTEVHLKDYPDQGHNELVLSLTKRETLSGTEPLAYRPEEPEHWAWEQHLLQALQPRIAEAIELKGQELRKKQEQQRQEAAERELNEKLLYERRHSPIA